MSEPSFPSLPPDDESADIVSRADALMRRTRPAPMLAPDPTGEAPHRKNPPNAAHPPEDAEDLPLLTDIVAEAHLPTPAGALPAAELDRLGAELVAALQARLAAEIPTLVEAAMQTAIADIARELCSGLTESANAALAAHLQRHLQPPQPPKMPRP